MYVYKTSQRIWDASIAVVLFGLLVWILATYSLVVWEPIDYVIITLITVITIRQFRRVIIRNRQIARVQRELREYYDELLLRLELFMSPKADVYHLSQSNGQNTMTITPEPMGRINIIYVDGSDPEFSPNGELVETVYSFDLPKVHGFTRRRCVLMTRTQIHVKFDPALDSSVKLPIGCELMDLDDVKKLHDAIVNWPVG